MRPRAARMLAQAEWDFAQVDAALADLGKVLHECAADAPDCGPAALQLKKIRRHLLTVWRKVEPSVNEAQALTETAEAPPF